MARGKPKTLARRPVREISSDYVSSLLAYADILFKAGMVPTGKNVIARPETVAAIIEVGRDVGLPATQALAWIMLVNGKPSIWGDAAMALIRSSGLLAEGYPKERFEGIEGNDDYAAVFAIKRNDGSPERVSRFSIEDAKRAKLWEKDGPWKTYPTRQLMWRAKGFACRDEFSDVLCGLIFTEEALDYPNIVVQARVEQQPTETPAPTSPATVTVTNVPSTNGTPVEQAAAQVAAEQKVREKCKPTDEQLDRLAELREALLTSKNLHLSTVTEDERRKAWLEVLAPYKVTSALDLTGEQFVTLIDGLSKLHDPFTHPPEKSGATSAA